MASLTSEPTYLGPDYGTAPCGLRVVPPGLTFDEGYEIDLRTLVGGLAAVGDLAIVSDTMAFLRVWHEEDVSEEVAIENVIHHYPEDRYVGAALALFASVALLFWYVLRLFLAARD